MKEAESNASTIVRDGADESRAPARHWPLRDKLFPGGPYSGQSGPHVVVLEHPVAAHGTVVTVFTPLPPVVVMFGPGPHFQLESG